MRKVWGRVACRDCIRSWKGRGTARTPTTVLTSTGKKTINAQIKTLEKMPGPNQMTSKGAMATTGMAWVATR